MPLWEIKETIHTANEFINLDWHNLDPAQFGRNWSIGKGGYGLNKDSWTIRDIHEDGSVDIWELPLGLSVAISTIKEITARDSKNIIQQEIRKALGLE